MTPSFIVAFLLMFWALLWIIKPAWLAVATLVVVLILSGILYKLQED